MNAPKPMGSVADQLLDNIHTTFARDNLEKIPEMARILHDSQRAAFFSHHFLWDVGLHIQSKFLTMGKYMEQYFDYTSQLDCARSLGPTDAAVVCTVGAATPPGTAISETLSRAAAASC